MSELEPFIELSLTTEQLEILDNMSIEELDAFFQELNERLKDLCQKGK